MIGGFKRIFLFGLLLIFNSCEKESLTEFPELMNDGEPMTEIRLVTYNMHGGEGPAGEGNFTSNVNRFSEMLMGDNILCFEEVKPGDWDELKSIFPEYVHRFYLQQCSTAFGPVERGGNAILSKMPIVDYDQALINTDPGGDRWERRAQYVKFYIGYNDSYLHVFHYHNTYNWHKNDSQAEKDGFVKFLQWVENKEIPTSQMRVIVDDFNLNEHQVDDVISESEFINSSYYYSNSRGVCHIYGNGKLLHAGTYNTAGELLSDHQAVWGVLCNDDCW